MNRQHQGVDTSQDLSYFIADDTAIRMYSMEGNRQTSIFNITDYAGYSSCKAAFMFFWSQCGQSSGESASVTTLPQVCTLSKLCMLSHGTAMSEVAKNVLHKRFLGDHSFSNAGIMTATVAQSLFE